MLFSPSTAEIFEFYKGSKLGPLEDRRSVNLSPTIYLVALPPKFSNDKDSKLFALEDLSLLLPLIGWKLLTYFTISI